jgi:hypothetical protein
MANSELARRLHSARDLATFVAVCSEQVASSPHVAINPSAIPGIVPLIRSVAPPNRDRFLRDPNAPIEDVWADFVFTMALDGGYFATDGFGGVRHWEEDGFGLTALVSWVRAIREAGVAPGIDLVTREDVQWALAPRLRGIPHAEARIAICEEFTRLDAWPGLTLLIDAYRNSDDASGACADGCGRVYRFDFRHVDALARHFPRSFSGDPFRRKAILAFHALAGHLAARGHRVTATLPVPADYQTLTSLEGFGVIMVEPAARKALGDEDMLDANHFIVEDLRAAAVVASRMIALFAGASNGAVYDALSAVAAPDHPCVATALPLRCASMWF